MESIRSMDTIGSCFTKLSGNSSMLGNCDLSLGTENSRLLIQTTWIAVPTYSARLREKRSMEFGSWGTLVKGGFCHRIRPGFKRSSHRAYPLNLSRLLFYDNGDSTDPLIPQRVAALFQAIL